MAFDDAAVRALFNSVQSHAMTLALFDVVNTHEPKNAPGNGLSCAIWVDYLGPVVGSGLSATSGYVVFNIRLYTSMLQEPQDAIDPNMLAAVTTLLNAYTGDFEFEDPVSGLPTADVRSIDLIGMYGRRMEAQSGYLNISNQMMRVMTISLPVIVNDLWSQTA